MLRGRAPAFGKTCPDPYPCADGRPKKGRDKIQGRPIPCSGAGLRPSKKLVRSPAPAPMDGPHKAGTEGCSVSTGIEKSCAQKRPQNAITVQQSHLGTPSHARNRPLEGKSVQHSHLETSSCARNRPHKAISVQHFFQHVLFPLLQNADRPAAAKTWRLKCCTLVFYANFRHAFAAENITISLTVKQLAATSLTQPIALRFFFVPCPSRRGFFFCIFALPS